MADINQASEYCRGVIERIVFHNEDNGFTVLRVKAKKQRELLTVVGITASAAVGEMIECQGEWIHNVTHGLQFKANSIRTILPDSIQGIEKYLASGAVKGIGPHFAKQLVMAFGLEVFEVIEHYPERLKELPGIGEMRAKMLTDSWQEQKQVRNIMMFLHLHGIGTARALRIYKLYGDKAVDLIQQNPYRLAHDVHGIGFKTADALGKKLGIADDAIVRLQAALQYVLQEASSKGHCAMTRTDLKDQTVQLLDINPELINKAIDAAVQQQQITEEHIHDCSYLFLNMLYRAECQVAEQLMRLQNGSKPRWLGGAQPADIIAWVEHQTKIKLSMSQQQAVTLALQKKLLIITGGPGVGKTTVLKSILSYLISKSINVTLCAPTGRAAKRLSEATHIPAKTIHRLLGRQSAAGGFAHNQHNPLQTELLVIDEISMVDVLLMQNLLKALPSHAGLLLVGDVDQLPSVGPGAVLTDLIASEVIPVVRLTQVFRQAAQSQIILNAHRINQGHMPAIPETVNKNELSDFYFIQAETPEEVQTKLLHLVETRVPQRFGYDPVRDIQVLTPMNRNALGAQQLNQLLQQHLNTRKEDGLTAFGYTYLPGDKVMQTINNYDKDVFNGDIGIVNKIDSDYQTLEVNFDGHVVHYQRNELDELSLAYAVTIHKSQGSEYPVVILPIVTQHFMLLERNLLYTAVTRGKKLVIVVGQPKALAIAIHTLRAKGRLTFLTYRLEQYVK